MLSCFAIALASVGGDVSANLSASFIRVYHTRRIFASHEVKRTLLIIEIVSMETWLLHTSVFFLTDVTFLCFSSVFKLESKEFLV